MGKKRKRDELTEDAETHKGKRSNTRSFSNLSAERELKGKYAANVKQHIIQHDHNYEKACHPKLDLISEFASATVYPEIVSPSITPAHQTATESPKSLQYSRRQMRLLIQEDDLDFDEIDTYKDDTFRYRLLIEEIHLPLRFLQHQTQMNEVLRLVLVKWITDVHHRHYLCQETLFKTVNIIDRFVSFMDVETESLQMFGLASLLIASKYEEVIPPDIDELIEEIDAKKSYRTLMKTFERIILKTISFNLSHPTSLYFLEYYANVCIQNADSNHTKDLKNSLALCRLVLELSLQDYQLSQIKPSLLSLCLWLQNIPSVKEISELIISKEYYSPSAFNDCYSKVNILISNLRRRYPNLNTLSERYKYFD